jgi:hypothetical protein
VSAFPDNVVTLDEYRRFPDTTEDVEPEPELASPHRHLRLVRPEATLFRLDTFLARAQIVMAEDEFDPGAAVMPLHAQPA